MTNTANVTQAETPREQCDAWSQEHDGYRATGERGTNPITGSPFEVHACQCGKNRLEVFPHLRQA